VTFLTAAWSLLRSPVVIAALLSAAAAFSVAWWWQGVRIGHLEVDVRTVSQERDGLREANRELHDSVTSQNRALVLLADESIARQQKAEAAIADVRRALTASGRQIALWRARASAEGADLLGCPAAVAEVRAGL
jgi:hypothetical protein